jgi:Cu(I)/Ag(I) efflux system membrane fusion protein
MAATPAASPQPHAGHDRSPAPTDRVSVTLTPERREVLGVRSEAVAVRDLTPEIRTVGRVTVDERRVHHIHTKFEGYVETLDVDFTGKFVRRGQPLASIFSPELVATQEEYLLALRAQERLGASQVATVAKGGADLLEAARRRLLLWDISPATIDRLERTGEVRRSLELYSPVSGYVVAKTAVHGMRAMPSDTLFDIADLSHLWVLADVYEQDLASVRVGTPAELSVTYLPDRTWKGNVTWIAPMVEEKTRTVKVRVEVDNADDQLKPEMFANVALRAPSGRAVVVPEGAVIRSGERNLVFVDEGEGRFTPREIRVGRKGATGVEVKSGLAEGERVVISANFLLDSESSLKAALAAMSRSVGGPSPGPARLPGHQH